MSAPVQSADGWNEWNGGKCPVEGHVIVETKGRDGGIDSDRADFWCWDWMPTWPESDIIAYRVVRP